MTIYGDLSDHALIDLAAVLRSRSGTLFLHQAYRTRTVEMTLTGGHVKETFLDGFPIRAFEQLQDVVARIVQEQQGSFEFDDRARPPRVDTFDLPFAELVRQATLSGSVPEDHLPRPATRFVLVPGATRAALTEQADWQRLLPYLSTGASAEELAGFTAQPQEVVRVQLHRFRIAGLIVPRRAVDGLEFGHLVGSPALPGSPLAPVAVEREERAVSPFSEHPSVPMIHRMLGALRRLTGAGRA